MLEDVSRVDRPVRGVRNAIHVDGISVLLVPGAKALIGRKPGKQGVGAASNVDPWILYVLVVPAVSDAMSVGLAGLASQLDGFWNGFEPSSHARPPHLLE